MGETRLEIADDPRGGGRDRPVVPPPLPPDDPEAWYAPNVERQDEIHPGVVVTIASRRTDFTYSVREPVLTAADPATLDRLERALGDDCDVQPRTREGAREAMAAGLEGFGNTYRLFWQTRSKPGVRARAAAVRRRIPAGSKRQIQRLPDGSTRSEAAPRYRPKTTTRIPAATQMGLADPATAANSAPVQTRARPTPASRRAVTSQL